MKRATAFLIAVFLMMGGVFTLAQNVPFQVEVVPETANMRWCPGNCRIKHFANAGHILSVLEVDTESDPPWTWYRARTPSGVEAWIRSDLVRQRPDAAPVAQPQQQEVVEPFPVVPDNFCNTALFRSCRHGSEHDLWQAGYWAKNRYDHWERGGWNLDIVYHLNPCKAQRVCSSREQWDAGLIEAEAAYKATLPTATATKESAQNQVRSPEATEIAPLNVNWIALVSTDIGGLPWDDYLTIDRLFDPPYEIKDGQTILGRFKYDGETVRFTCRFWHNAGREPTDFAPVGPKTIREFPDDDDLKCLSNNINENEVVARQWYIKIERRYAGEGAVRNVKWTLEGTYGIEPAAACVNITTGDRLDAGPCKTTLDPVMITYLRGHKMRNKDKPSPAGSPTFTDNPVPQPTACRGTMNVRDNRPGREVTEYRHRCEYEADDYDLDLAVDVTRANQEQGLKPK